MMVMVVVMLMTILMMIDGDNGSFLMAVKMLTFVEEKQSFLVFPLSPSAHFLAIFIQV